MRNIDLPPIWLFGFIALVLIAAQLLPGWVSDTPELMAWAGACPDRSGIDGLCSCFLTGQDHTNPASPRGSADNNSLAKGPAIRSIWLMRSSSRVNPLDRDLANAGDCSGVRLDFDGAFHQTGRSETT